MAFETDVILRTIYMYACKAESLEELLQELEAIVGEANVALAKKHLKKEKKQSAKAQD